MLRINDNIIRVVIVFDSNGSLIATITITITIYYDKIVIYCEG